MKKSDNIIIDFLDLGHGVYIENDEWKSYDNATESEDDALELDDAFAEMIDMAEKIDKYFEEHGL